MVYEWIPKGYCHSFALTELSATSIPLNRLLVHSKATFPQHIGRLSRSLAGQACAQRPAGTISPLPHTEGCCQGIPLPGPRLWGVLALSPSLFFNLLLFSFLLFFSLFSFFRIASHSYCHAAAYAGSGTGCFFSIAEAFTAATCFC